MQNEEVQIIPKSKEIKAALIQKTESWNRPAVFFRHVGHKN